MDQKPQNPLAKHFRQPAIYVKLPSGGKYWADGSLELPVTGEIPVYPMTARDEITLRTPDALLNGQGVVDIIQSCCPNIKDAWKMPSVDVDFILLNIRVASYGPSMDFDTICPKCQEESNFAFDIGSLSGQITMPDYTSPIEANGLKIELKPQEYFEVNKTNQVTFTEQQIIRTINDSDLSDEEKKAKTDAYLQKLIDLNIDICAKSTQSITTEDAVVVTNPEFIKEFFDMADYKIMRIIQKRLEDINNQVALKPVHVTCSSCTNEYNVPLNFDYANFFA
jgi:hypothetical protein